LDYLTTLFQLLKLASNGRMVTNDDLEGMWNEEFVGYFKILFQYLSGGFENPHSG